MNVHKMEHEDNCPAKYNGMLDSWCICEPEEELINALVVAWKEFELNWKYQIELLPLN